MAGFCLCGLSGRGGCTIMDVNQKKNRQKQKNKKPVKDKKAAESLGNPMRKESLAQLT